MEQESYEEKISVNPRALGGNEEEQEAAKEQTRERGGDVRGPS